ncbi:MAG: aminopeptidase [Tenericutes bacterium]|nr:aminopeptidase [Mycoplasmatota bacterium]
MKKELLNKLAELAVKVGANVQKGQLVGINSCTENRELVRLIVKNAYEVGASNVIVKWNDEYVGNFGYIYKSEEALSKVMPWMIDEIKHFVEEDSCIISIASPIPDLNKDVDPKKLQIAGLAQRKALGFFYMHMMASKCQWTIVAAPNEVWAEKVFPNLEGNEATEKLWDAILKASRVTEDNDPIKEWAEHNEKMHKHNEVLNGYHFDSLVFKNSLGTDVSVKLVDKHIWAGGKELTTKNIYFNPNIPTEESFTMPHKLGVNGKVVATKPLNYQGRLIEDFWFIFKDGKVVDYDARVNKEALDNLLNTDEGSKYLGEIALISFDSPISNSNILFYNTLFDENASCHMALGRGIPFSIEGGATMGPEDMAKNGFNYSLSHSDFMFGSEDLSVIGITKEGKEVVIFEEGNFII